MKKYSYEILMTIKTLLIVGVLSLYVMRGYDLVEWHPKHSPLILACGALGVLIDVKKEKEINQ